ncbi:MAG: aldehyde dehydrogenase family protein, partial [Myxococcota bacterium]
MTTETVPSESPAPSAQLPCINPATGALIRELPIATEADVAQAVQAARLAFESWSRQTIARRASYLLRARDIMLDRRHQLLEQMIEETGKARVDATADIAMLAEAIGFYCGCAEETLADRAVQSRILRNKRLKVQYMPRGVVVNISPWNYPLELAWAPLIPALLAGNVVINKPSEVTPLISLA